MGHSAGEEELPERSFAFLDDPARRPHRLRTAARVIMIDPEDRVLLFCDTDPGLPEFRWWVTPGGGIDEGESEREAAVREVAEETGSTITEDDLIGPIARRVAVHGYSDQILEQSECFFLARVTAFEVDTSAFTEEEKITMQDHRWWSRAELAAGVEWIWPAELADLIDLADDAERAGEWPRDLGRVTEESTRPL